MMNTKKEKFILAIDLGTSGPKSAIISVRGGVISSAFEPNKLDLLPGGGAEQNPMEWWETIQSTCKKAIATSGVNKDDIVGVGCTTQWCGTVAVDQAGEPLMNAITWMDSRGKKYIREIVDGLIKIDGFGLNRLLKYIRLTGGLPSNSGKDPIAHILYIKNEFPDIYENTHKFLEPKDFINFKLTGKFATSPDTITMHWLTDNRDIDNVQYHPTLFKFAGLKLENFPEIKQPCSILGDLKPEVARDLGLSDECKVYIGAPDIMSAAAGAGAVKDYHGHIYVGTSSWMLAHVPFKKVDPIHYIATLPSAIPGRYIITDEQETAGACLTYLRDKIFFPDDLLGTGKPPENVYKLFDKMVEEVPPGSNSLIFTPWLYGERSPIEDHTVRSSFFNQSLTTTRADMIRSVYEGVAFNNRWLLKHVENMMKRPFEFINIIGGGANSAVWCQIFADVLGREIRRVKDPINSNARGVALLTAATLGYIELDEITDLVKVENTYTPNGENKEIYDSLFREFINLYKQNKEAHKRLQNHPWGLR
jgi:xylulokinase